MQISRRDILAGAGAMVWASALRASPADFLRIEGPAFGAGWRIVVAAGADTGGIITAVTAIVASVDAAMSPFRPTSEIGIFNRLQTVDWLPLSPQTRSTLRHAKRIAALTNGAFDPTLGGIVGRYGFGPITTPPAGSFADLAIDDRGARKSDAGQTLDLCGIAKGHALDRIAAALSGLGHGDFFIELGGEVFARGQHPQGRPWRAGIERPLPGPAMLHRQVSIDGEALATSGDRINSYFYAGHRYSHIIDPRRLAPAESTLASVSVFARRAIAADALATALFAMGSEKGPAFAQDRRIPALFVFRDGQGLRDAATADFAARFIGQDVP